MKKRISALFLICICLSLSLTGCFESRSNNKEQAETLIPYSSPVPAGKPRMTTLEKTPPVKFMPDRLEIPSIAVKTAIKPVTILANSQMDVPKDTDVAGILYPGILPGEKGNVIIDGHVDSYTGPAVFYKLKKLKPGDRIILSDKKHRQLVYTVESTATYAPADAPVERIFGKTEEYRLNLITCTGRYSRKKKEHEHRLVIFAKIGDT